MRLNCLFSLLTIFVVLMVLNPSNARIENQKQRKVEKFNTNRREQDDVGGETIPPTGDNNGGGGGGGLDFGATESTVEPTPPTGDAGDMDGGDYDYYVDVDGDGDYDYYADVDGDGSDMGGGDMGGGDMGGGGGDVDGGDMGGGDMDGGDIGGGGGDIDGGDIDGGDDMGGGDMGGIPTPAPIDNTAGGGGGWQPPTPAPVADNEGWPTFPTPAPVYPAYPTWPTDPPQIPTDPPVVPYHAEDDDPLQQEETDDEIKNNWQWGKGETIEEMEHDQNVVIALSVVGAIGLCLALISAQQIIENPDGCCARYVFFLYF